MFGPFKKDPIKKLNKEYRSLLEQGMQAQRKGDMRAYADLTERANKKLGEIEILKRN